MIAMPASAQMFGNDFGADLDYDRFSTGFGESGVYDAFDYNDDTFLDREEYRTGLFADFDRDGDRMLTGDEFEAGYNRYALREGAAEYSPTMFEDYDGDSSGALEVGEFDTYYTDNFGDDFAGFDTDADGLLNYDEYGTGLYNAADRDRDQVLTIEEEGWFEGWFDGNDWDAEVESVREAYTDL
jgi:hypothetical protein